MILVTGGYGCIGAELIKWLLTQTDHEVLLGSRTVSDERTARIFRGVDTARLTCVPLDVSNLEQLQAAFSDHMITHVAHLAALQTPDCNAHRDLGLRINLGGTQKLLETIKTADRQLERCVFASSLAVYGPRADYPAGPVPMDASPNPVNVYGTWKLAGEQLCRFFCDDTGTPTVCLRPGVLFGPGRDAGLTSTPTTALKCVALGKPYQIPYQTQQDYLYAPDVGAAFGNALLKPFRGFGTYTLPSRTIAMAELVAAMREAAAHVGLGEQFQITHGTDEVPFICELEWDAFAQAFPQAPHTSIDQALQASLRVFQEHVANGWLRDA